jgi:excisionase family DNA binding protein
MDPIFVKMKEAANLLGVSQKTLINWDNSGKFKAYRTVGKHRRYKLQDINDFIEKQQ